ncbi:MAG TPA: hypothetical protein VJU61_17730 [Polyangiaceae bacterium]|nr:hypothetical protein [Polyangiaceae bacterium]
MEEAMPARQRGPGECAAIIDHGLEALGASRLWFEGRLRDLGITLHPGSRLARGLRKLQDLERSATAGDAIKFPSPVEGQRWFLDALGADFLCKAMHRGERGLTGFEDRWRSLKSGDPILTGPSELQGKVTRPRDLSWELLLASIVAHFAPVRKQEPDLVCTFNGMDIGLAAKVSYTGNEGQFLDQIQEGARQIERQGVDAGFVVVNMVEHFPHECMFKNFLDAGISDPRVLYELVAGWGDAFLRPYPPPKWARHLRGMSKLLSVMMFVPTILPLVGKSSVLPYYRIHTFGIEGREEQAYPFEQALQTACETLPGFLSGLHAASRPLYS